MTLKELLSKIDEILSEYPHAIDMEVVTEAGDYGLYHPIDGLVEIGERSGNDFTCQEEMEYLQAEGGGLTSILIT